MRKMCIDLLEELKTNGMQVLMVSGCPGVGKSVEVYSYAMWQARKCRKRVLYIHSNISRGLFVIFKDDADELTSHVCQIPRGTDSIKLLPYIKKLLDDGKVDLIVLDGAHMLLIREMYIIMIEYKNAKMITCTSYSGGLGKISSENYVQSAGLKLFTMESWSLDEYRSAINADALNIKREELDERFYYAGGSVRFIQMSIGSVITFFELKIPKVNDMDKLVGTGGVGEATDDAVNSLMAIYNGYHVIISKYVTQMLLKQVASDVWIARARSTLENNPVWQGWVTEYEVLNSARIGELLLYNPPHSPEAWLATSTLTAFKDANCAVLKVNDHVGWFLPMRWNHECFDALFRASQDTLRVVQITDGKEHSCKLKYLIPYVTAMKVCFVDFVFVCGRKNFESFKVFDPNQKSELRPQYNNLITALRTVLNERKIRKHSEPSILFRKVCYQII